LPAYRRLVRRRARASRAPRAAIGGSTAQGARAERAKVLPARLELRHRRLRHVLVLLRGASAPPARALDHAVADDPHRAHAGVHGAARGGADALDDRRAGALGELAAGAAEGDRRDGLALRAVDAAPDGAVHAVEGDQPAAGVADGGAHLDVHL